MTPVKLIIFDLDDTLFDTTGQLHQRQIELEQITPFPGVVDLLGFVRSSGVFSAIVSTGEEPLQRHKIAALGLEPLVDVVHICESPDDKLDRFQRCLRQFSALPRETLIVGDRIDREIRFGKTLGCLTMRLLQGRHGNMIPEDEGQVPDFTLVSISQLRGWLCRWLTPLPAVWENPPFSEAADTLRTISEGGCVLIRWFVEAVKRFRPRRDTERKKILEWFSERLRIASAAGAIPDSIVSDYFFSPVGMGATDILLPKFPRIMDSPRTTENKPACDRSMESGRVEDLVELILRRSMTRHPYCVRIAGGAGGGKTTLATTLVRKAIEAGLRAKHVSLDAYAFPRQIRDKRMLEGLQMYEWDKVEAMLSSLHGGKPFHARASDRLLGISTYEEEQTCPAELDLFVLDGIYALVGGVFSRFHLGMYVNESDEKRFQRRLERDQVLKGYTPTHIAWTFAITQFPEFWQVRESSGNAQVIIRSEESRYFVRGQPLDGDSTLQL